VTLQQIRIAFREPSFSVMKKETSEMKKNEKISEIRKGKSKELCDFCGGTLYPKIVNLEFRVKGELIVIEEVPAEVCNRCGEKYLSAEVDAGVEQLLKSNPKAEKTITVPVFKWMAAARA
jgi:YgiT-type zinc finger domain-containing protein